MINIKPRKKLKKDMMILLKFTKKIIKSFRIMSLTLINKIRIRIKIKFRKTVKFQNKYFILTCIMR